MKTSIGDIIDRFTICKLKSDKLNLDLSEEIDTLSLEMESYNNIDDYINELYTINEKIWNLESDIRKGNENILGLEEIGRRALKIRDFNNIRVSIKNKINSHFNEGFIEHKMNHGSEKEKSLIISLTTVPERLLNENEDGLKLVLKSLCEQIDDDYEVHFNIPNIYNITKKPYIIPNWINETKLKYPHLKIFRTEDMGPPTKFIPTLLRLKNEETIVIVVDDDLVYHNEMIIEHRKYQKILNDSVVGYDGRGSQTPLFNDIRDSWVICVTEIRQTHGLQHYKSVSYKKKLFGEDFFTHYVGKTLSDDVLISKYFMNNNIKMFVVPYEKENHLYETRELWDINQGVTSFPVLRYASSVENTGCNNPELLKLQPKFFEPIEFNILKHDNSNYNFQTDKISHGFMEIYSPLFSKHKNFKKILEIGVYKGESLKLLSYFFEEAFIYGIDIVECEKLHSDKIKTYICDQENRDELNDLIEKIGGEFDLVIDDGGHMMKQQQISLGFIFKHLKKGGIYIIEDLHTSKISRFITENDKITTLEMLNNFNLKGEIISNHMTNEEKVYLEKNIKSIKIWSRTIDFNESVTSIITKK